MLSRGPFHIELVWTTITMFSQSPTISTMTKHLVNKARLWVGDQQMLFTCSFMHTFEDVKSYWSPSFQTHVTALPALLIVLQTLMLIFSHLQIGCVLTSCYTPDIALRQDFCAHSEPERFASWHHSSTVTDRVLPLCLRPEWQGGQRTVGVGGRRASQLH